MSATVRANAFNNIFSLFCNETIRKSYCWNNLFGETKSLAAFSTSKMYML